MFHPSSKRSIVKFSFQYGYYRILLLEEGVDKISLNEQDLDVKKGELERLGDNKLTGNTVCSRAIFKKEWEKHLDFLSEFPR